MKMRGSDGGGFTFLTTAVTVVVTIEMLLPKISSGCRLTSPGDVTNVVVASLIVVDELGSYPPSVVVPL